MHNPLLRFKRSPERKVLMMSASRYIRATDRLICRNDEPIWAISRQVF